MRWFALLFALPLVACDGGDDDRDKKGDDDDDTAGSTYDPPEMSLSVATSGEFAVSMNFGDDELGTSAGWSGDENDCTNVQRGIRGRSGDVEVTLTISGCTVLSAGGPPITVPAQMRVVSLARDEDWASNYYDGAAGVAVDGCEMTISEVFRWEDSPWFDEHLYASGTYTCATLFSGFSDDDTEIYVSPGTFTLDWSTSDPTT